MLYRTVNGQRYVQVIRPTSVVCQTGCQDCAAYPIGPLCYALAAQSPTCNDIHVSLQREGLRFHWALEPAATDELED